jgi:3-deoxy-7-phosphoheptulonate synthase
LIVMRSNANDNEVKAIVCKIEKLGLRTDVSQGEIQTVIGIIGDESKVNFEQLASMNGVDSIKRIQAPYKLMTKEYLQRDKIEIEVGKSIIGNENIMYIAGPCSVESYDQLARIGEQVKIAGASVLRGGTFKPRTSIHSFQGLGENGLKHLQKVGKQLDMPTVTEVRSENHAELVAEYVDILQIGTRNMYNQDLLEAVAKQNKPILFKRGQASQISEYLSFGQYIIGTGNRQIILCERGIIPLGGSFEQDTRNTLDISAVPILKAKTPFPVIVDPSHGTGKRELILPMSMAAIAAGADGLIIEVHDKPEEALSDGAQSLKPDKLKELISKCNEIKKIIRS